MPFALPQLPYAKDALAPHISAETLDYHHGKHHNAYVTKLNSLIEGTELADKPLGWFLTNKGEISGGLFNQAAQHFNHDFYWKCLSPNGGGAPTGPLAAAIDASFGGFSAFKEKFTAEATGHFGSGWAWLVKDSAGKLSIISTHDADTPAAHGFTPLLTCDVWEHAYYVDFRNARPKYVEAFWNLVNWDFVGANL